MMHPNYPPLMSGTSDVNCPFILGSWTVYEKDKTELQQIRLLEKSFSKN
jgi:hypothetical protein